MNSPLFIFGVNFQNMYFIFIIMEHRGILTIYFLLQFFESVKSSRGVNINGYCGDIPKAFIVIGTHTFYNYIKKYLSQLPIPFKTVRICPPPQKKIELYCSLTGSLYSRAGILNRCLTCSITFSERCNEDNILQSMV